jgi:transposase
VKSNKNDFVDAEAIAEAVERKNMRFVPIKTDDQLDLQAMHRIRDRLVSRRTAVINQMCECTAHKPFSISPTFFQGRFEWVRQFLIFLFLY